MCATAGGSGARAATARCLRRRPRRGRRVERARPTALGRAPRALPQAAARISLGRGAARRGPDAAAACAGRSAPPRATRSFPAGVWSDHFDTPEQQTGAATQPARRSPWCATTLIATMAVLGVAALVHVVRYALLIVNRTVLLNPWVAGAATWLGVAVSVIAMFMVVASAVRADELADRPAGRRVRASRARGSPVGCGRCGPGVWCRWSTWCGRRSSSSSWPASRSG